MVWNKTPKEKEVLILEALLDFSKTQQDIAKKFGVSKDTVGRLIKQLPECVRKERYSKINHYAKLGSKNPMKGKERMEHHNAKNKTSSSGYLLVWAPDWWEGHRPHPNRAFEHHINWAIAHSKTKVPPKHVIHHKDENKQNNSADNLECMTRAEHMRLHANIYWSNVQRLSREGVGNSVPEAHGVLNKDRDIV
jgi:DNA-binding Lrp family transcriptional regulator